MDHFATHYFGIIGCYACISSILGYCITQKGVYSVINTTLIRILIRILYSYLWSNSKLIVPAIKGYQPGWMKAFQPHFFFSLNWEVTNVTYNCYAIVFTCDCMHTNYCSHRLFRLWYSPWTNINVICLSGRLGLPLIVSITLINASEVCNASISDYFHLNDRESSLFNPKTRWLKSTIIVTQWAVCSGNCLLRDVEFIMQSNEAKFRLESTSLRTQKKDWFSPCLTPVTCLPFNAFLRT